MNILTATDAALARLRQEIDNEIRRRTLVHTDGCDPAAIIYGNELAKRALTVAVAGGHSILFLGSPNSGKTMMRALALELGHADTFEARPCRCGYRSHRTVACTCTVQQIERHTHKLPIVEIMIEMVEPTSREIGVVGTTSGDVKRQIKKSATYTNCELRADCRHLLNAAISQLAIDVVAQRQIVQVARTIANLDTSKEIKPQHLAEAIYYRPPWRS